MVRISSILKRIMNPDKPGPVKVHLLGARETLKRLPDGKNWFCGGIRSVSIAAHLLLQNKIIAVPTDTIYGLAGLAQNNDSIKQIYNIKKRDTSKPLAICLADTQDIQNWAYQDHLPNGLLDALLPGPTTVILKRKTSLNPLLNPGINNVGIRVPNFDFIRKVIKAINQPIALTSANESNQRSTLHPSEFSDLWPKLDGVFYERMSTDKLRNSWRKGSSIIDLTMEGEFKVIRAGISYRKTISILKKYGLVHIKKEDVKLNKNEEVSSTDDKVKLAN